VRAWLAIASLALVMPGAWGQPPLPPAARPHDLGLVADIKPAESILLETGASALMSEATKVSGPYNRALAGDLVELAYGPEGTVSEITILPRRTQLRPLADLRAEKGAAYRAYWQHEGQVYPDSLRTADVRLNASGIALQVVGQAAYDEAEATQPPAAFGLYDQDGKVLWQQQLAPGQMAAFRCPVRGASYLQLKCLGANGEALSDWACVWVSPMLVLRQMEYVALRPQVSVQLAQALAQRLGKVDPGAVAIGMPQVIGLSDEMARDLRDDLFVAMGGRCKVVGALPRTTAWPPSQEDQTAAKALGANAILVSQLRYVGPQTQVHARLLTVADNEELASAEVTFE